MRQSGESPDRRRATLPRFGPIVVAVITAVITAVAAGCGGSSDDETSPSEGDQAVVTEEDSASDTDTDDPEAPSDDQDTSGNYATVIIGADTYEVPPDGLNLCNSLANMVFGSFAIATDGSPTQAGGTDAAIQVNFGVPVTNWEEEGLQAPTVNLDLLDDGVRWFASVDRGLGSVDSWELADGKATGEATFEAEEVGSGNVLGPESGRFEIVCR